MTESAVIKLDRVLVVDDDDMVRRVLVEVASEVSMEVEAAASGQAALDALATKSFDLLITDLRMPGVTGLDVVRYARDRYPSMHVIVVTGFAGAEEERAVGQFDAVFLHKPFGSDEFRRAVRRALGR
jgi:CheY-like chemotaxis protein